MRIAFFILLTAMTGPVLALATTPAPKEPGLRFVVHAPWKDGDEIALKASVNSVGPVQTAMGMFVNARDTHADDRLRAAGAWMVLDGRAIASICGVQL